MITLAQTLKPDTDSFDALRNLRASDLSTSDYLTYAIHFVLDGLRLNPNGANILAIIATAATIFVIVAAAALGFYLARRLQVMLARAVEVRLAQRPPRMIPVADDVLARIGSIRHSVMVSGGYETLSADDLEFLSSNDRTISDAEAKNLYQRAERLRFGDNIHRDDHFDDEDSRFNQLIEKVEQDGGYSGLEYRDLLFLSGHATLDAEAKHEVQEAMDAFIEWEVNEDRFNA